MSELDSLIFSACEVRVQLNEQHQAMQDAFPDTVEAAREMIRTYLQLHDPSRLRVFQGQAAADYTLVDQLNYALFSICGLLQQEQEGNPNVTPLQKDIWCRTYLKLPFRAIDGDQV
ncbi:MAG: hypothetical protein ACPF9D_05645 [Owenweeksia sp.]